MAERPSPGVGLSCRRPHTSNSTVLRSDDAKRLNALLARHVGAPLNVDALEQDISIVAGLIAIRR